MLTRKISWSDVVTTGLAMFSMFFGAGNVVFPLKLGIEAGGYGLYAFIGFAITAIASPFIGLASMVLYDGDYKKFFYRLGAATGSILIVLIVCLIGPLAAIPRCIALSHTTISMFAPDISIFWFSMFSGFAIFLFSIKESRIIDVLGRVLSPFLLVSLAIIIIKGFFGSPPLVWPDQGALAFFCHGLYGGYQTMDLLAAMFFSSVVLVLLKRSLNARDAHDNKRIALATLQSGMIGGFLLAVVYGGLCIVASLWSGMLQDVPYDMTMGVISYNILGSFGGLIASICVALACLTTAITLATVFSEYVHQEIFSRRLPYSVCLLGTVLISVIFANQGFDWIIFYVWPILKLCYPALIVLAIVNILYKLTGFRWVKVPVFLAFIGTIIVMYGEFALQTIGVMMGSA